MEGEVVPHPLPAQGLRMGFSREVTPQDSSQALRDPLGLLTLECELLSGLRGEGVVRVWGWGGCAEALGLVFPTHTEGLGPLPPRKAPRLLVLMSHLCLKKCKTGF